MSGKRKVFKLHIKPSGISKIGNALKDDELIIGWHVEGLLNSSYTRNIFVDKLYNAFYIKNID